MRPRACTGSGQIVVGTMTPHSSVMTSTVAFEHTLRQRGARSTTAATVSASGYMVMH